MSLGIRGSLDVEYLNGELHYSLPSVLPAEPPGDPDPETPLVVSRPAPLDYDPDCTYPGCGGTGTVWNGSQVVKCPRCG